jgi:nitrogen fixation protein FixH
MTSRRVTDTTFAGSTRLLTITITDVDGDPVNPTSIEATVTAPDGTVTTGTPTTTVTGTYTYEVEVLTSGRWTVTIDADGTADVSAECTIIATPTATHP